jgi:C4-dicarboxylate-specific signal transduction histidine kinase
MRTGQPAIGARHRGGPLEIKVEVIVADADLLHQALLLNLVRNAVDAMWNRRPRPTWP